MANYPQLDDCSGVWTLKEVHDAVAGGYWRNAGSIGLIGGVGAAVTVDQIKMSTAANSTDFGDLTVAREGMTGMSSFTRGVFGGNQSDTTVIDYCNFSSAGNFADFGDLTEAVGTFGGAASSSTRGIKGGGDTGPSITNIIDYITIASTGNALDFGNLTAARTTSNASNPTRALFQGGSEPGASNRIDFITIANTGNASDFGDLVATNRSGTGGVTSSTRSVMMGGVDPDGESTTTQFLTIASQGNATEYGDLTRAEQNAAGLSNSVRGICAGGQTPSNTNVIDFFTISVGGTAVDFGDLSAAGTMGGGTSNAHGGLNDGYQGTRFVNSPTGGPVPRGVPLGTIGLFNAGEISAGTNVMDFINIASTGNATDWGNLSAANANGGATASETRYVTNGNNTASLDMNYVEFASKGNTALFGDLTVRRHVGGTGGNKTRGIMYSGFNPDNSRGDTADGACNVIDFITYASLGNATNFGDANVASFFAGGCSSATRTLKFGGISEGPATLTDSIEFVSTASAGNGADFGNLIAANQSPTLGPISNSTRGVVAGGKTPGFDNVIQFVTLASEGNATNFGDLTSARSHPGGACSSIRGTFAGGEEPSVVNRIDFVTIASAGNAADFGDLTITVSRHGGNSNGNGGLS